MFTSYNGTTAGRLLRLNADGTPDATFNPGGAGFSSDIYALVQQPDGKIVVGGSFSSYNGDSNVPDNLFRIGPDGDPDPNFNTGFSGFNLYVSSLALQPDNKIIVGGYFTSYNGNASAPDKLVRINPNGTLDLTFNAGGAGFAGAAVTTVRTVTLRSDGKILVSGAFGSFNGATGISRNVVRLTATGGYDTSFNPSGTGFNGNDVMALVQQPDGRLVAGGSFTTYNGISQSTPYLARLKPDGGYDPSFNPGGMGFMQLGSPGAVVYTLAEQPDGYLLAGGTFNTYNGIEDVPDRLLRLTPEGLWDNSFNTGGSGFNGVVYAVTLQPDGKVLVGGDFTSYNGNAAAPDRLVRLNADGTLDASFNVGAGFNASVRSIVLQPDGRVLVGGWYTLYKGAGARGLIRLNADASRDASFNAGGAGFTGGVYALALQPDGKVVVAGDFTAYNGDAAIPDRLFRLNADGTPDPDFNTGGGGYNQAVEAVLVQPDGKIVVGGNFTSYNGSPGITDYLGRLTTLGAPDISFNAGSGPSNLVRTLALQPDGKLLVGGSFSGYNGNNSASSYLIRVSSAGALDNTFNTGGSGFNSTVEQVLVSASGKLLVGGQFTTYNGNEQAPNYLLRLNADGSLNDAAGPVTGATYTWSNGETGPSITVSQAGSYTATASIGGSCTATSAPVVVTVAAPLPDLVVSSAQGIQGSYNNLTVTATGVATLSGSLTITGTLTVQNGGVLAQNCQPLTGAGSFTLEAGAELRICDPAGISASGATGAVQVTGTRTFSPDALYSYVGTAAQVTGSGLPAFSRSLRLDNAAGLTLSQNLSLTQALALTTGLLLTGSYQVALTETATLAESASSYLIGTLAATRQLTTTAAVDFGGLGLTLTPSTANGAALPGATLVRRVTGTSITGPGSSASIKRYFDIQPAVNQHLDVTLRFTYADSELNGLPENELTLFRSSTGLTGPWQPVGYTSRDTDANTVTLAGISHFSIWTLGSSATPLPVELRSFTAEQSDNVARLRWTTAQEKNNAYFEVQASTDGTSFRPVGRVQGYGSSTSQRSYSFLDKQLLAYDAALVHYRLQQVDQDGSSSLSAVRTLAPTAVPGLTMQAYPNPTTNGPLTVQVRTASTGPASLTVTDSLGRSVLSRPTVLDKGTNHLLLLEAAQWKAGIYLLRVQQAGQQQAVRLVCP